jgi:DNA polymerase-1
VKKFKGYPCTKLKLVEFNPKSRDHIARVLINQGWKPEKLTEGGKPQIDEETVESIVARYPEMAASAST